MSVLADASFLSVTPCFLKETHVTDHSPLYPQLSSCAAVAHGESMTLSLPYCAKEIAGFVLNDM